MWSEARQQAAFEYAPGFARNGWELSPLLMPLRPQGRVYTFPALAKETYKGLPGLLADSLPDRYGNALMDAWLARQGRDPNSMNPVERLCYLGTRGMGALEFRPLVGPQGPDQPLEVEALVALAQAVLDRSAGWEARLLHEDAASINTILQVGTSAGGARAKALIAYNPTTHEVRSGQVQAAPGFEHWLLKFDGVTGATTVADPLGYGRIEYAYYRMATACGISMTECRLLEENNRAHFLTRRFDRTPEGGRLHMQTLCGLAHYDYNNPLAYSYEQAFGIMRRLRLPYADAHQLWLRMAFNVLAANLDDHTKNISFLMDQNGTWRLAPAYDVTYAYSSGHQWLGQHQLSVNGKRNGITDEDMLTVAKSMNIKTAQKDLAHIRSIIAQWPRFAAEANVSPTQIEAIGGVLGG
jgi:serine/threonine-protein kinase HipA